MEELSAKHRKEQKELQGRITQKKKAATKKTRKGVNDECETLERELEARQGEEIAALEGSNGVEETSEPDQPDVETSANSGNSQSHTNGVSVAIGMSNLNMSDGTNQDLEGENGSRAKKPNRQKARLARRAAEQEAAAEEAAAEASNLPDLREKERRAMLEHFKKHALQEKVIRADGHCLYSAVADQLGQQGLGLKPRVTLQVKPEEGAQESQPDYRVVRSAAADFIEANKDDFEPFLEESLFTYVHKVRDTGEWGGHMELLALAKTYSIAINVLHGDGRIDKIEGDDSSVEPIWLGYYRHGYGLGEHYNSLRKAP